MLFCFMFFFFFFFKQKTAYEMRISDWSSDVCSSDLSAHPIIAPYQTYTCSDGELALGGGNNSIWKRILTVIDKPEWDHDPRFVSPKTRVANREALAECLNQVLIKRTRKEWERDFLAAGVPAGPVQTIGEARSEERRGGKGGVRTGRSRWSAEP